MGKHVIKIIASNLSKSTVLLGNFGPNWTSSWTEQAAKYKNLCSLFPVSDPFHPLMIVEDLYYYIANSRGWIQSCLMFLTAVPTI